MRKEKCSTQYGVYERQKIKQPDKTLFRLRIKALLLSDEFKKFCSNPDIWDLECLVHNAWNNFPLWVENHRDDHCLICLLFYGNIFHKEIEYTWTSFKEAMNNLHRVYRPLPFCELAPGTPAPPNSATISFDSSLNHNDLLRLFRGFLSKQEIDVTLPHSPLSGYFELQPKAKWTEVSRAIDAATRAIELREKHPRTWLQRMEKLYMNYMGNNNSRRRIIYRDIKKGRNISDWALRGFFPRTTNLPK